MLHTKIGSSEVTYTKFSYHEVDIWNINLQFPLKTVEIKYNNRVPYI